MNQQYLIRSGSLMGFSDLVNDLGGDFKQLLSKVDLTQSDLLDGDNMVPFEAMVMLLEHAACDLNCPSFGLKLSTYQDLQALGSLGLLLKSCVTVREAMVCAQRYLALHSPAECWRFSEEGRFTYITRFENFHGISHARQYKELSFGVCFRLAQALAGKNVQGYRLEFSHRPISGLNLYRKFFSMGVSFNQEYDRLIVDRKYLSQPITGFNEKNHHQIEDHLTELLALHGVAGLLHLHRRTLQRKLKDKGLYFKSILNEVRINTACWHLEASNMDITLLSEILGYRDISAFSRAFKSEMKCSALQWRKKKQSVKEH